MTCAIIDYGSGNLHSAVKSFERAATESGANTKIILTNEPNTIKAADRIVLPGVGAYADCLNGLEAIEGLREALEEAVIQNAKPFFGICVGMQLMSTEGHEHKVTQGLNWIPGKVKAITPTNPTLKIPHMGWNTLKVSSKGSDADRAVAGGQSEAPEKNGVEIERKTVDGQSGLHPVLKDINLGPAGLHAYFVHSYHYEVDNPAHRLLTTNYGGDITAMIGRDNIIGTQFHPEKSQKLGLKLIANFLNWRP